METGTSLMEIICNHCGDGVSILLGQSLMVMSSAGALLNAKISPLYNVLWECLCCCFHVNYIVICVLVSQIYLDCHQVCDVGSAILWEQVFCWMAQTWLHFSLVHSHYCITAKAVLYTPGPLTLWSKKETGII